MFKARQYTLLFLLMSFLFLLLFRLFFLQISGFQKFSEMAAEQHNRVLKAEPRRGALYDGRMEPLAISLDSKSFYADPRIVEDKEGASRILSGILDVNEDVLIERLNREKSFVWLQRKVDEDKADRIEELNIKGVGFVTESKRHYPNDSMAAHVIGFASIDNEGLEGIELQYNAKLKGKPGWKYLVRDAKRRTVLFNERDSIPPQNGYNIVLTIDSVVQCIAEEELHRMVSRYNVENATAIVMEPFSGKVLALANYPDYNLNAFSGTPKKNIKNASIYSVFEPGSVFKVVTASAALVEERFDLDDNIYCEKGNYKVGGRILHDFHPFGELTFKDVIAKSSNIGTVKVARALGKDIVYKYVCKFGFGEKTGIDLPGEVSGISRHPYAWSGSDITTIPIGQGIAVTPIQLACAISVIANGGFLVKPQVVDWITTGEGELYRQYAQVIKARVLSEQTCNKIKDILRKVVTEGTGRLADSKLYETCGKTGTAQMVAPEGGYYSNKYNAAFIGFAPKEKPLVSVVVIAWEPHPVYFGGKVAAPTFREITERTLQYLESNQNEK